MISRRESGLERTTVSSKRMKHAHSNDHIETRSASGSVWSDSDTLHVTLNISELQAINILLAGFSVRHRLRLIRSPVALAGA